MIRGCLFETRFHSPLMSAQCAHARVSTFEDTSLCQRPRHATLAHAIPRRQRHDMDAPPMPHVWRQRDSVAAMPHPPPSLAGGGVASGTPWDSGTSRRQPIPHTSPATTRHNSPQLAANTPRIDDHPLTGMLVLFRGVDGLNGRLRDCRAAPAICPVSASRALIPSSQGTLGTIIPTTH